MRYEAPKTIKEAAGLLAKAKGSAFVLAGGTDLLVRMQERHDRARPAGRRQADSVDADGHARPRSGFRIGGGGAVRGTRRKRGAEESVAGRRGGGESDRLRPDSEPLHDRRQSVQCIARGGQRAGDGGGGRESGGRRAERQAHHRGGRCRHRSRQDVAEERRGDRGDHAAEAGAEIRRCVSAVHSAHRDGYRGGQRRCHA